MAAAPPVVPMGRMASPLQPLAVSGLKSQNREQRSVNRMCSLLPPGILGYMDGPQARLQGSAMG